MNKFSELPPTYQIRLLQLTIEDLKKDYSIPHNKIVELFEKNYNIIIKKIYEMVTEGEQ